MQYLLDEAEMQDVTRLRQEAAVRPNATLLKNVALHMACDMLDLQPANGAKPLDGAHGCIHVKDRGRQPGYCDRCPASAICPQPKKWSK